MVFKPNAGLNIITGETGAGKSIMLGALGLVLGNRADSTAILNPTEKCVVEAVFESNAETVHQFLLEKGLDDGPELILRREITATGKSRSFINDTPVGLSDLKDLGVWLIEIHTQNTTLLLKNAEMQLLLLDEFGVDDQILQNYQLKWSNYKSLEQQCTLLKEQVKRDQEERDFLQFQFEELDKVKPMDGEEVSLEARLSVLNNVNEIVENSQKVMGVFMENENSVYSLLNGAKALLKNIAPYNDRLKDALLRTESLMLEIKELSSEISDFSESVDANPQEIEALNNRISALQHLMRKHHVDSSLALQNIHESLEQKLNKSASDEGLVSELEKQLAQSKADCLKTAEELHRLRLNAGKDLSARIPQLLQKLGMPKAVMNIECTMMPEKLGKTGCTDVAIYFNADGGNMQLMEKVVSGGEASRINFCFKSVIADSKNLPTIVFDEADSGVSGEVAINFGEMMHQMGASHQIITITHLPQVAAFGSSHFQVYKENENGKTNTAMKKLTETERIAYIAQMLGGSDPGEAALANAKELLGLN